MEKIKVLIVDDHYMFLKGLESIINDDSSLEVVGEAHNGKEAVELAFEIKPDVILMDVDMPTVGGIDALKKIMKDLPELNVLMMTNDDSEESLMEAMRYGAKGYLTKHLLPNELLVFIHMAYRGEYIISSPLAKKVMEANTCGGPSAAENEEVAEKKENVLTRREKEILSHVIKGMTNRQIANALFISENTVKNHIRNIMEKLQMNNRLSAANYAKKEGWLQLV
jgi:two-component system, NarL family, nitrate/nitrite response regulator NarL